MEAVGGAVFSEADIQWRSKRTEEDKLQQDFYKQLDFFPNLFSLKHLLHDNNLVWTLLETQQSQIEDDCFPYDLERKRCQNLIIYFQYLLGHKQEAMDYSDSIQKTMTKSIIFLTMQAVLQWECNYKDESQTTLSALQDGYKLQDYNYLVAVAEAEKGYLLLSLGPRGFLGAMDLLQKAIDKCQGSDIYLWKFDLGLAIRRNFNIIAYSEHHELSSSVLATRAVKLLNDTAQNCPNDVYKARGLVEMARLVDHLSVFADGFCREKDKKAIKNLCESYGHGNVLFEKALAMECSRSDHYVLRECGRSFLYTGHLKKALHILDEACKIQSNSIVFQLFGKVYRKMYLKGMDFISSTQESRLSSPNFHPVCSDVRPSSKSCQLCSPGTCPLQQNQSLAKRLEAEMDQTPFIDSSGQFQTTQADGVGGILPNRLKDDDRFPLSQRFSNSCTPSSPYHLTSEAQRLEDEFDHNPFMDEYGEFITTQSEGIWGIQSGRPPDKFIHCETVGPSSSKRRLAEDGTSQHSERWSTFNCHFPPSRVQSNEERLLHSEFETSSEAFLNPDGTFGSTQALEIGNSAHHSEPINKENKYRFKSSHSFPPATRRMKDVLKCRVAQNYLNPANPCIQAAERFFLKALEENPMNMAVVFDTGSLYEGQHKPEKALKFYQHIIFHKEHSSPIYLVNAYERSGLCLMEMSKEDQHSDVQQKLKKRAEDMFMSSLVECSRAVAHMPEVSANRSKLWGSYPLLLRLLRSQSEAGEGGTTRRLNKEASVHEAVGNYLKAIEVYKDILELAKTVTRRTVALRRSLELYLRLNQVKEAKFILDLFLLPASDDRERILKAEDDDTKQLRDVAVQIYMKAAIQALMTGDIHNINDAQTSFQSALLLKSRLLDRRPAEAADANLVPLRNAAAGHEAGCTRRGMSDDFNHGIHGTGVEMMEDQFDICIFYDDDSPVEGLELVSTAMASIMREIFGLRVTVNSHGTTPGHLAFESELCMAESTVLVMLVITPGSKLSPRMTYIANTVLQSHAKDQVLPVIVGQDSATGFLARSFSPDQSPSYCRQLLPPLLRGLEPYYEAEKCLAVNVHDIKNHVSTIDSLFLFLLKEGCDKRFFE